MENNVDTIIGINVILKGNLKNKGSIQVNGTVEGEIRSDENINVGETAKIQGPVVAKTIEISGEVKGVVEASEKLELNPTAKVIGDINAKSLIIKQGASFVGKSIMPSDHTTDHAPSTELPKIAEIKKAEKEEPGSSEEDKFGFFRKK